MSWDSNPGEAESGVWRAKERTSHRVGVTDRTFPRAMMAPSREDPVSLRSSGADRGPKGSGCGAQAGYEIEAAGWVSDERELCGVWQRGDFPPRPKGQRCSPRLR